MKELLQLKNFQSLDSETIGRGHALFPFFCCLLFFFLPQLVSSQSLRDNVWVFGAAGQGVTMDFSTVPVDLSVNSISMGHFAANASICDTLGNLLFYTNGVYVASANNQPMWNGLNLDLGLLAGSGGWGSNMPQVIMALPLPNSPNIYYLFYKALIEVEPDILSSKFYYSKIDMSKNQGKGMIVEKNQLILEGAYLDWGKITACKHANGRDWWILLGEADSKQFQKFLLTPDGVIFKGVFDVELPVNLGLGQAVYSPNGEKYVILNLVSTDIGNYLDLFYFDRCVGILSNQLQTHYMDGAGAGGVAFSPNSRFLYVSSMNYLYQFDMEADDIIASKDTIGTYDGFESPFWANFFLPQLAPDGKIYICAANGTDILHVINNPNEKGQACNFVQHGVQLPTGIGFSMPNFPYFNLGALPGSPCDTLGVSAAKEEGQRGRVEVSPNPASEYVVISLPQYIKDAIFTLHSTTGQLVFIQQLAEGQESMVGLEGIAPGLYFYEVRDSGRLLGSGKLVRVE